VAFVAGTDTVPAAGARVVLHRVGRVVQGPVDSTRADGLGRFRFRFASDSASLYLLSARFRNIEYFSEPIGPDGTTGAGVTLLVADTSSTAPVTVEARYLLVGGAAEAEGRTILDIVVLRNAGPRTRVAPDSVRPTFAMPLPPDATRTRVEDGTEISLEAVALVRDSLFLTAPLAPGRRQIVLSHVVPLDARRIRIPLGAEIDTVTVLTEEAGVRVQGGAVRPVAPQIVDDRAVPRWTGPGRAGDVLELRLPGAARAGEGVLAWLVAAAASAFAVAALWLLRRRRPGAAGRGPSLLDELAALDARYGGREADVPAAEWAGYQAERARLKRALAAALAVGKDPS